MTNELASLARNSITRATSSGDACLPSGIMVSKMVATLLVPRGIWGFASDRWGWSLLPVGYKVRVPR